MTAPKPAVPRIPTSDDVEHYLRDLKLTFMAEHYRDLAQQAAHQHWAHLDYLGHLVEGEARLRQDRATQRRILSGQNIQIHIFTGIYAPLAHRILC